MSSSIRNIVKMFWTLGIHQLCVSWMQGHLAMNNSNFSQFTSSAQHISWRPSKPIFGDIIKNNLPNLWSTLYYIQSPDIRKMRGALGIGSTSSKLVRNFIPLASSFFLSSSMSRQKWCERAQAERIATDFFILKDKDFLRILHLLMSNPNVISILMRSCERK